MLKDTLPWAEEENYPDSDYMYEAEHTPDHYELYGWTNEE